METSSRAIPSGKDKTMTVQELISRLFDRIQSGELKGSDPVPADLFEDDVLERYGVTEYIAKKYGMEGDDQDGR